MDDYNELRGKLQTIISKILINDNIKDFTNLEPSDVLAFYFI